MNLLPVITRELQTQSRQPVTFLIRIAAVLVLLPPFCLFIVSFGNSGEVKGDEIFSYLNLALFSGIWIVTPLVVADCISRERREGTLGLLFLTPLRAGEIVIAKGVTHGLRAFSLWLAAVPIVVVTLLMGGVGWLDVALSVLFNLGSLAIALGAGVLASSLGKSWTRVSLFAALLSLLALVALSYALGFGLLIAMSHFSPPGGRIFTMPVSPTRSVAAGFFVATDMSRSWESLGALFRGRGPAVLLGMAGVAAGLSALLLIGSIWLAGRFMRRNWQDAPPSPWQVKSEQVLLKPLFGAGLLKRWQQRRLDRNPVGWLQRRTWSARLMSWGWLAISAAASILCLDYSVGSGFRDAEQVVLVFLLGSLAATAAGGFRRERENGVLELLLVSPASEGQIIKGRLTSIWSQFLPALLWLEGAWLFLSWNFRPAQNFGIPSLLFAGAFLILPIVGLYYSLHRKSFMGALMLTLLVGVALPVLPSALLAWAFYVFEDNLTLRFLLQSLLGLINSQGFLLLAQLLIGGYYVRKLHWDLVHRNFALNRGGA